MTRRQVAAVLLALCGVVLLLTWHGYEGHPVVIWENPGSFRLNELDFVLKVVGIAFLAAALLAWPPRRSS